MHVVVPFPFFNVIEFILLFAFHDSPQSKRDCKFMKGRSYLAETDHTKLFMRQSFVFFVIYYFWDTCQCVLKSMIPGGEPSGGTVSAVCSKYYIYLVTMNKNRKGSDVAT